MKLLIATGIYPPEIGGPAGYVKRLATELVDQGHKVSIVTYGDNPEANSKFQIAKIKSSENVLVRYVKYAYQVYKLGRDVDIIYVQGPVSEGLPATFANLLLRKPLVMKIVGDYAWEQAQQGRTQNSELRTPKEMLDKFVEHPHRGKIRIFEVIERWTSRRAKRVITPSKYLKGILEKWGIAPEKISVIYNGVAQLPSVEPREELRAKQELGNRKMILTAGRAISLKRVDFLLECLTKLPDEYVLAVAGDGPSLSSWKERAKELKLQDRVAWLGQLDKQELTRFYKMADIFALASSHETMPHVLIEAVSLGLPCVASSKGGIIELAEMFPEMIKTVEFDDQEAWVEALTSLVPRRSSHVELPSNLSFGVMVEKTLDVLKDTDNSKLQIANCKSCLSGKDDTSLSVLSIGTEKHLFKPGAIRDRIVAQADSQTKLTIIVFAKQKFDEQITENVRVISTNSISKWLYIFDAIRVALRLHKQKFDVVTTQDPIESAFVGLIAAMRFGASLAIQDHGYHFHGDYYAKESFLNRLRYLFARFVIKRADAIRVVSKRTKNALINLGVAKEKIVRFPLSLNSKFQIANCKSDPVDERRGTSDVRRNCFLLVCRFVPIKRIDITIHAFSLVAKQHQDVKLKIIGQGPLKDQIQEWAKQFNIAERVQILPWTEDISSEYQNALATIITSDREGFGMTAVESLSCGTPVIMTNVGCAGEVVIDSQNGYIVPIGDVAALADRMEKLINNPDSFKQNVATFSPEKPEMGMKDFWKQAV